MNYFKLYVTLLLSLTLTLTNLIYAQSDSDLENGNVSVPNYDAGSWQEESTIMRGTFYQQYVEFDDSYAGYLYRGGNSGKYFISDGLNDFYYINYNTAIKALYIYRRYGIIMLAGMD